MFYMLIALLQFSASDWKWGIDYIISIFGTIHNMLFLEHDVAVDDCSVIVGYIWDGSKWVLYILIYLKHNEKKNLC